MTFFWLIIHFSVLLVVKLAIPFSLYIMHIILIFPFHILHSFHLFYLGGPTFPFWAPKSLRPAAHLLGNYEYLFQCTSFTLFESFISTYIHSFHLSYLGSTSISVGGTQNLRTQKNTVVVKLPI